jgi:hypothetical protein
VAQENVEIVRRAIENPTSQPTPGAVINNGT